ncbi:Protein CLEC16A [Lamellibrachia satsuma]|nr:Protein CLEC16A [Lamellibrachia satsuma]
MHVQSCAVADTVTASQAAYAGYSVIMAYPVWGTSLSTRHYPMFPRQKGWFSGGGGKPRNPHSLEHLKYLYTILSKNQTNDSSVFDFFLEKNMLSFFTTFMQQKTGVYICTQLLQTLNILFENIRNETSLYFLLSNNHINMIILHKFDFSDEEVMAYYISFLKSLSLKLNKHTVHFFYNEHTNDFALYTEAIKFFNHPENMVRIAVRTITLNVFRACLSPSLLDAHGRPVVEDETMLRYIRDKTAVPYFSNLVWFIGNHVLLLDTCVRHDTDHNSRDRLSDLVAEHLNHLHYLNDILSLHITALNDVLTDHLLNNLFLPLYVYSLTKRNKYMPSRGEKPHLSSVVSLFLLSQVFLIIQHAPVVRPLADIIFNCDLNMCVMDDLEPSHLPSRGKVCEFMLCSAPRVEGRCSRGKVCEFLRPAKLLTESFQSSRLAERRANHKSRRERVSGTEKPDTSQSTFYYSESESAAVAGRTGLLRT